MTHSLRTTILHATHKLVLRNVVARFQHLPLLRAHRLIDLILLLLSLFVCTFLILRILFCASWVLRSTLIGLRLSFSQSKHVGETKLADTVAIWDLAFSLTQLAPSVKLVSNAALTWLHAESRLALFKVSECSLSKYKVSFVGIVLHWSL